MWSLKQSPVTYGSFWSKVREVSSSMFLLYQLALTSCSQCTGKQIVTFKKKLNTVKMSCTASSMNISQTCPGKLRGPMLWNNTACCQPWDHRYFLIFCNFTQRLLSFTQNNFYFFTLSCTVRILFDIENVIEVAFLQPKYFSSFPFLEFAFDCFLFHTKIKDVG